MDRLKQSGYACYLVGGSIRNIILGLTPKDFDMTTDAKPYDLLRIFSDCKTLTAGIKHGTVGIVLDGKVYEVTSFRIDGEYTDSRRPDTVQFTGSLREDLSRRDFTMNALAYSPEVGLVDYFSGADDIAEGIIRCVGDAELRMQEDALRILRALRFASVYGFSLEEGTSLAVTKNKALLNNISAERINTELRGILTGKNVGQVLRQYREVFAVYIPELIPTFDCPQNTPHHDKTVWEHIVTAVESCENTELLRTVMLLHDICKPDARTTDANGRDHFKGHDILSADRAEVILKRLRFPNVFVKRAVKLIRYHDYRIRNDKIRAKHLLSNIGEEDFRLLIKIQYADTVAQSMYLREEKLNGIRISKKLLDEIIDNDECCFLSQLKVKGNDLIQHGFPSGEGIGQLLHRLLSAVIDGKVSNNTEDLLAFAKKEYCLYL